MTCGGIGDARVYSGVVRVSHFALGRVLTESQGMCAPSCCRPDMYPCTFSYAPAHPRCSRSVAALAWTGASISTETWRAAIIFPTTKLLRRRTMCDHSARAARRCSATQLTVIKSAHVTTQPGDLVIILSNDELLAADPKRSLPCTSHGCIDLCCRRAQNRAFLLQPGWEQGRPDTSA